MRNTDGFVMFNKKLRPISFYNIDAGWKSQVEECVMGYCRFDFKDN
jgi:hypothetical protein